MELSKDTIVSYTSALKKIFVIEDCPAWSPNLRSKTAIRTSDTRYFVAPSIASRRPDKLLSDLRIVFSRRSASAICGSIPRRWAEACTAFRTGEGLECDAVIHLRNGSYGLVEIKLGSDKLIEEGAQTLKAVVGKIDMTKMKEPSFMMVLTGT